MRSARPWCEALGVPRCRLVILCPLPPREMSSFSWGCRTGSPPNETGDAWLSPWAHCCAAVLKDLISPVLLCGACRLRNISQQTGAPCKREAWLLGRALWLPQRGCGLEPHWKCCLCATTKRAHCPSATLALLSPALEDWAAEPCDPAPDSAWEQGKWDASSSVSEH